MQKKRESFHVRQLLSQIQELQDKVNSLSEEIEIYDILRQRAALECLHVPSQPSRNPSPKGMLRRDSCLPHKTQNSMGTSGNVFEDLPAPEGPSPSFFKNPRNLTSSSRELRPGNTRNTMTHGKGLRREPQSSTIPTARFARKYETWDPLYHTGGTFSRKCMMEVPRYTISELHFGKSQTQVTYNVGESTSRPKCV